jgi:hypothetical protein
MKPYLIIGLFMLFAIPIARAETFTYCDGNYSLVKITQVKLDVTNLQTRYINTTESVTCNFGCDDVNGKCRNDPLYIYVGVFLIIIAFFVLLFWIYRKW